MQMGPMAERRDSGARVAGHSRLKPSVTQEADTTLDRLPFRPDCGRRPKSVGSDKTALGAGLRSGHERSCCCRKLLARSMGPLQNRPSPKGPINPGVDVGNLEAHPWIAY